jgi:hypothetical protein
MKLGVTFCSARVGAAGFEPTTSRTRIVHATTALRPGLGRANPE